MVPLVVYEPRINALFVAPIDSPLAGPRDVRERAVAFANPTSLVAMYGQQWLRQQGLEANQDYAVKGVRTDLGVGRMMLTGEAAAAIMSNGEFRALPAEESSRLKVVEIFARMPNFIVLGHPRVGREQLAQLKTQLKDFLADKDDGAAFAQATGFTAIVDVDEAQLRELDAFAAPTRRAMGLRREPQPAASAAWRGASMTDRRPAPATPRARSPRRSARATPLRTGVAPAFGPQGLAAVHASLLDTRVDELRVALDDHRGRQRPRRRPRRRTSRAR